MSATGIAAEPRATTAAATTSAEGDWRRWLPLVALLALGAALRFGTIDLQSLWFDEAFTPTHVLHHGLGATLHTVRHTENTPPLYYVVLWAWTRLFGSGAIALRAPSAIAGTATIAVAWAVGLELGSRRIATVLAALIAVSPLFVWYSQEARAYIWLALFAALSYLYFERSRRAPSARSLTLWALCSGLALVTHYFAVFLVAPEALILLWRSRLGRRELIATGAVTAVGAALVPLIVSQGGHGTEWIAQGSLRKRLIAIPQYLVLGPSGGPLGHGLVLAGCVLLAASLVFWPRLARRDQDTVLVAVGLAAFGVLAPLLLAGAGYDYLAPRNVIASFIPLLAAVAVLLGAPRAGRAPGAGRAPLAAPALAIAICVAALAVVIDVDLSPRVQRGDWRGLARVLRTASEPRVLVTPELGSAPLEYYLPGVTRLATDATTTAGEVDMVGYSPIRAGAAQPPAPGLRLVARRSVHGLVAYVFRAARPLDVGEAALRAQRLTEAHTQVLVPRG